MIATNPDAEALIKLNERDADGRKSWKDLQLHYEGIGMHAIDIKAANKILKNLVYKGEFPPKETWDLFESKLNTAFATYVKHFKRQTHCNEMKLSTLTDAIQCPKMAAVSASINVAITSGSTLYTYEYAMAAYKAEVAKNKTDSTQRDVRETNNNRPWFNTGRGRGSGRGRDGGRGRYSGRGGGGYLGSIEL